jgi:hypothetical protein
MQVRDRHDNEGFTVNTVDHSVRKSRQAATTNTWLNLKDTIAERPWLAGRPCPIHQGILVLNRWLARYTSQPPHQAHFEPG